MSAAITTPGATQHPRWPWAVAGFAIAVLLAGAWLDVVATSDGFEPEGAFFFAALAAFGVVGALIVSRVPGQLIGRLFLVVSLGGATTILSDLWVVAEPPLPGRGWMALLNHAAIPLSIGLIPFVVLRFPDGRLPSPRWRWVERIAIVALSLLTVGALLSPRFVDYEGIRNPIGVGRAGSLLDALAGIGWIALLPTIVLAGVSQVFRFRRSRGEQREQLKVFAFGGAFLAVGWILISVSFDDTPGDLSSRLLSIPYFVALLAFPVLCGVAILRYGWFDIDVAIRRTVVFGALAAFIVGVYVAIVVGIGSLVGSGDEPTVGLQIAATAVVAIAFEPVRARVTRFANRLVYGERATPYEVMATVSRRVAETVSVVDVLPEMARVAAGGVAATSGRVRLHLPRGEREVWWPETAHEEHEPDVAVGVAYAGSEIGDLAVWKPRGETVTPAERALLEDLAAQAGLALHNVRLTEELAIRTEDLARQAEELRRSRERLVTARDVQRRRLEQDIREGPHRQLLGIGAAVREATTTLERDPDAAAATLDELGEGATSTLEGLRDLARGIFPPLLVDEGIVAALEAHIRKIGANTTIDVDGPTRTARFDPEIEATAYFFCLQALQNVIRHAGNARAVVSIERDAGTLAFAIADDGPGFDPGTVDRGMGLQIMEDRVEALGGSFAVDSAPGHGTTVTGRIPVDEAPST